MIDFTPEQMQAIQKALGNTAAKASAVLQEPIARIEAFLENVAAFIRKGHQTIGERQYVLVFEKSEAGKNQLTPTEALRNIRCNKCVFIVDESLRLVRAIEVGGPLTLTLSAEMTEQMGALAALAIGGTEVDFLCGKLLNDGNVVHPHAGPFASSRYHHPMSDFTLLLSDHKENSLDREAGVRYWKDRKSRVLLAAPDKTEVIFHRDLFKWLKLFVTDKLDIYGETVGLGQDKTDIVVLTFEDSFIIEVKWLGENENGTSYDEARINEGLAQLRIYMDDKPECGCGHLVVYDGRSRGDHESHSAHNDTHRHHKCQPPHIMFLESETAAEAAARIVKSAER